MIVEIDPMAAWEIVQIVRSMPKDIDASAEVLRALSVLASRIELGIKAALEQNACDQDRQADAYRRNGASSKAHDFDTAAAVYRMIADILGQRPELAS